MVLDDKNWYFFDDFEHKPPSNALSFRVKTYAPGPRKDYECYLLTSADVMNELRYEPEVIGFSVRNTYLKPYPVFCASLKTSDVQHLLDKYKIQGIWVSQPRVDLTYS